MKWHPSWRAWCMMVLHAVFAHLTVLGMVPGASGRDAACAQVFPGCGAEEQEGHGSTGLRWQCGQVGSKKSWENQASQFEKVHCVSGKAMRACATSRRSASCPERGRCARSATDAGVGKGAAAEADDAEADAEAGAEDEEVVRAVLVAEAGNTWS